MQCKHSEFVKSFKVPTSRECKQCGLLELPALLQVIMRLDGEKEELLKIIADLQDVIAAKSNAVTDGFIPMPETIEQAKGMHLVATSWLKHNAPEEYSTTGGQR